MRDPRVDPRPGDVLDDDAPAPPLVVDRTDREDLVSAARYTQVRGHPSDCVCDAGCACTFMGAWSLADWRRDMADAVVLYVSQQGELPDTEVMWQQVEPGEVAELPREARHG